MTYNFDEIIDRQGTLSYKYDRLKENFGRSDLLPLWVADMDFATPPCVMDTLRQRLNHPVLGYNRDPDDWAPAIIDWQREHHGWNVNPDHLCFINGIMKGMGLAINHLVAHDERVIIQPPVYHMFAHVANGNRRQIVRNPLRERADGLYDMDLNHLESMLKSGDGKHRMLIISNPHNPGGVCWTADTLRRLAEICAEHNIIVVSDEIHADMALFNHKHVPFASVSDTAANISITFGAPTKVFNMPGVVSSWAIIPNDDLRSRYVGWLEGNELTDSNLFAMPAAIAAYRHGDEWRRQMLAYVEGNIRLVEDYCHQHFMADNGTTQLIRPIRPEASFLVWLDCRALGLNDDALHDLFTNRARLALNYGTMFGPGGEGHMRMNVAVPRAILQQALEQLRNAL